MSEAFILEYLPMKIKQLGYKNYHIRYRDIRVGRCSKESISAYNDLYFIVDDPYGVVVESDYGIYDSTGDYIKDNVHLHRGEITIENKTEESRRIKFIQAIIIS